MSALDSPRSKIHSLFTNPARILDSHKTLGTDYNSWVTTNLGQISDTLVDRVLRLYIIWYLDSESNIAKDSWALFGTAGSPDSKYCPLLENICIKVIFICSISTSENYTIAIHFYEVRVPMQVVLRVLVIYKYRYSVAKLNIRSQHGISKHIRSWYILHF